MKGSGVFSCLLFGSFFAVVYIGFAHTAHALGVTPSEISVSDILRNSSQTAYVTLSKENSQRSKEMTYSTEVRSDYPGVLKIESEVSIPAGSISAQIPFTIDPGTLANGSYSAILVFHEKGASTDSISGAGAAVTPGVAVRVGFTVGGEEHVSYEVRDLQVSPTETDDAVPIEFTIINSGNVSWRPEYAEIVFADQADSANVVTARIEGTDIDVVSPGATATVTLDIDTHLIQGTYIATLIVYDSGAEVARIASQPFDVFPPNTLAQSGELHTVTANKNTFQENERIQIAGDFENTGDVRVSSKLVISILKNNSVVDIRTTDPIDIDVGESTQLSDTFLLERSGTYTLNVLAEYGNKKTPVQTLTITVKAGWRSYIPYILIGLISCVVLWFAFLLGKRRRKHTVEKKRPSKRSHTAKRKHKKSSH